MKISACVVCRNEADVLPDCLRSLQWVDEIVEMDLRSADTSASVAAAYGARVVQHDVVPFVELVRQDVIDSSTGDWVLVADPDERVTPGLARELRRLSTEGGCDAVEIPISNRYLGFPASHPLQRFEAHVRMFRRGAISWPRVVHSQPKLEGLRVARVPQRDDLVLIHESWRSVDSVVERMLRYVPAEAQTLLDGGIRFSIWRMLLAVVEDVDTHFFSERAWRDGVPGLIRASLFLSYRLLVWAKFWELSGRPVVQSSNPGLRQIGVVLERLRALAAIGGASVRFLRRAIGRSKHRSLPLES